MITGEADCGNGTVETGEDCDKVNGQFNACCKEDCTFSPSGTLCRAANGVCDVADTCSGASDSCTDKFASSNTVCRSSVGICDVVENCTGSSNACPGDSVAAATTVCRVSVGMCDLTESCTGFSNTCPTDSFAAIGTTCRDASLVCDVKETCTGSSNTCPVDSFASTTTVCRASAGACDVVENCSGNSAACPSDARAPATTVCRASIDTTCDPAENCPGDLVTLSCPADVNNCSPPSTTTPITTHSPSPIPTPSGTEGAVCRQPTDVCDMPEKSMRIQSVLSCPTEDPQFSPKKDVCYVDPNRRFCRNKPQTPCLDGWDCLFPLASFEIIKENLCFGNFCLNDGIQRCDKASECNQSAIGQMVKVENINVLPMLLDNLCPEPPSGGCVVRTTGGVPQCVSL